MAKIAPNTSTAYPDVAAIRWHHTPNDRGHYTIEQIQNAGIYASRDLLIEIRDTLQAINSNLLQLGRDGLHEILKDERTKRRRALAQRRAKARAARLRRTANQE